MLSKMNSKSPSSGSHGIAVVEKPVSGAKQGKHLWGSYPRAISTAIQQVSCADLPCQKAKDPEGCHHNYI